MNFFIAAIVIIALNLVYCQNDTDIVLDDSFLRVKPSVSGRIIGGESVKDSAAPWMISLGLFVSPYYYRVCSGTLIDNSNILTSASCCETLARFPISYWRVAVGITNLYYLSYSNLKAVASCKKHESYNSYDHSNDIAIMRLSLPLVLSSRIKTICLDNSASNSYKGPGYVAGWGKVSNTLYPYTLQGLQFCVLDPTVCENTFSASIFKRSSQYCAGDSDRTGTSIRKDVCGADGGGPLFTVTSGQVKQIGIISYMAIRQDLYGRTISQCDGLSGHTAVSSYRSWIQNSIGRTISSLSCQSSIASNFINNINPITC